MHTWLRRYEAEGLGGLVDRSKRPLSCPHQSPAELGLEVTGQRLAPDRAVLACRVVEPDGWCRRDRRLQTPTYTLDWDELSIVGP